MTIEQLQSEKIVLKEKIEKALMEFYEATGLKVSGEFSMEENYATTPYGPSFETYTKPVVTINPIEI